MDANFDIALTFQNATTKTTYTFHPRSTMRAVDTARVMQLFLAVKNSAAPKDAVDAYLHQYSLMQYFTVTTTPL